MADVVRMPRIAADTAELVLQEWVVAEGGAVTAGEAVATVETDKAVVDVEAEGDGVLLRALVPAGTRVRPGEPIAVVGAVGEQAPAPDTFPDEAAVRGEAPGPKAAPAGPESGHGAGAEAGARVFASPLARRIAREAGIALSEVDGSGPRGRIRRADVEAAVETTRSARTAEAASAAPPVAAPPAAPTPAAAYTEIPHTRLRRAAAARLTESKRTAPHFYLRGTARVDRLTALRERLNAEGAGTRVSVNDLVVKAAARALVLEPGLNTTWTDTATRVHSSADVAVAVATDAGLVAPVLRDVDHRSVGAVAAAVRDLTDRASAGRLRQDELEGGTLTVTNLGMFGTEEFAAIINPPHAAILAVGAARREPVVEDGAVVAGTVMRCTLSADHRPVDGVAAARWMRAFLDLLENPLRILL
ncbi:dihydrolipoamide acetyltransferase family protein [Nocardiopsis sp. NPDC050513]|uniref:dihydrolipoamide acetyltransferase family protein n=1 Tax=Nocardiopsis sp. NPDC050513 TaxID=3364338 RepID=UPI003790908A